MSVGTPLGTPLDPPASPFPFEHARFRLDLARPEDNVDICRLFREVHVAGELEVNQERDPDFFALQRMHGCATGAAVLGAAVLGAAVPGPGARGDATTWLARDPEGQAVAIGSVIVRDGWLDGARIRTGYLCDLRVRPGFRGGLALAACYPRVLAHIARVTGAEVFTTVIFDDNEVARKVLSGKGAERRGQPVYRPMTPFDMTSVQFTRRRRAPARVVAATEADRAEIGDFLARRGQERVLGEDFTGDLLDRRLADWPGFSLADFLLVREGGRLVGCCAPWDTRDVKRTRVVGYNGPMVWVRRAFDLGAFFLRYPPLPAPGECFRFAFLTHLEVVDERADILRDLVLAAYARLYDRRLHFLSALVPRGSPLAGAFQGLTVQRNAMTLYSVALRGGPWAERSFEGRHSGFEMALS
ncbi:MAG: hypothetical protein Q8P18_28600 [Pseudomonadota bacterium]|nr:hypothetical protein [Pseudomonadota bacterium]